ncbi:MAG: hypothetical protein ACRDHZ_25725, partial [Ktedonobacteraceae bacterium]
MNSKNYFLRHFAVQSQMPRRPAVCIGLVALAIMLSFYRPSRAADRRLPTLQGIATVYEKHHQALKSLLVQSTSRIHPIIPIEDLLSTGFIPIDKSDATVCVKGRKIYCRSAAKRRSVDALMTELSQEDPQIKQIPDAIKKLSGTVFLRRLNQKPFKTDDRILVYDGSKLHEKMPNDLMAGDVEREGYRVAHTPQVNYLPQT